MKKTVAIILFAFVIVSVNAQTQVSLSYGINLSSQERKVYPYSLDSMRFLPDLNAQLTVDLHLWKIVFLSGELGYTQAGFGYNRSIDYYQTLNYVTFRGFLKFATPFVPLYMRAGGYAGYFLGCSVMDKGQLKEIPRGMYKYFDYGIISCIGLKWEFNFFSYFIELRYTLGTYNISNLSYNLVYNRQISVLAGIGLIIP